MKSHKRLVAVFALAGIGSVLSACGGGSAPQSSGTFSLSPTSLAFNAANTRSTVFPQTITGTATGLNANTLYIRVEATGSVVSNISGVTLTSPTTGVATVTPASPSQLGAGSYTSTITVYACTSDITCQTAQLTGSPQTIPVTYNINGVKPSTNALSYSLTNTSTVADKKISLTMSGYPATVAWTASANQPWLKLSATSGNINAAAALDVSIDETAGRLKNGSYSGEVLVVPTTGVAETILVTLTVDRTQVDFVSPSTAVSTESREVIIRGAHFDAASVTGIHFGAQNATAYNIVSASEIRATHPVLTAGVYPVTLVGSASVALSLATLTVVDPTNFAAKALPSVLNGFPITDVGGIIYDAKRQNILLMGFQAPPLQGTVTLYSYAGNNNWNANSLGLDFTTLYSMAFSADGDTLLLAEKSDSQEASLLYIPLDATATGYAPHYLLDDAATQMKNIAVASDGRVVIMSGTDTASSLRPAWSLPSSFPVGSIATGFTAPAITKLLVPTAASPNVFVDGKVGASLDGSRVLLASATSATGSPHMYSYSTATGQLTDTGQTIKADSMQLDRTGSRLLVNKVDMYDNAFQLLGHLPATTLAAVISPDGSKVYAYNSNAHIKRFNATTLMEEADWAAVASAGNVLNRVVMTISPGGEMLFIAGSDSVLVEPVR